MVEWGVEGAGVVDYGGVFVGGCMSLSGLVVGIYSFLACNANTEAWSLFSADQC